MNKDAIRKTLEKYDYAWWRVMESAREIGRKIHLMYLPHNRDSLDKTYEYAQFIIEIIDKAREVNDGCG